MDYHTSFQVKCHSMAKSMYILYGREGTKWKGEVQKAGCAMRSLRVWGNKKQISPPWGRMLKASVRLVEMACVI